MQATSAVVNAIQDSVEPNLIEVGGLEYSDKPLHLPPLEREAVTLSAQTLTAVIDFLKASQSEDWAKDVMIQVRDHQHVEVVGRLYGREKGRDTYLSVDCSRLVKTKFPFECFISPESFVIGLSSEFADSEHRAYALRVAGNITAEDVTTAADNGLSQSATVRQNVISTADEEIKPWVKLAPYRTFREIEQPESDFLLRLKRKDRGLPKVALFPADGDMWKHTAIQSIKDWLASELKSAGLDYPIIA